MFSLQITDAFFSGGEPVYLTNVDRYASRGVLIDDQMRVAMMHIRANNYYKLPGGGIEHDETPEEAFNREVKEETGYECKIIKQIGIIEEHKNKNNFLQSSYCYLAKVTGIHSLQALSKSEKEKLNLELCWLSFSEAIKIMNQSHLECNDYSFKFMLLRDSIILNETWKVLKEAGQLD